ncbi:MAG TPA: HEAT repeat domain-containing protein [Polyangiaceae bacterium]|nr:HEAT repeat domain-containing protein [Polyangiaceae bacterium]
MVRLLRARIAVLASLLTALSGAAGAGPGDEIVWPAGIQSVESRLASPSAEVRRSAAAELGKLPDSVQLRMLPGLFSDPDPAVRLLVADAALQIRLPDAGARVIKWLSDPDARVRASAAEVLGVLPHPGSAAALGRVLEDPDASVRAAAALALANSEAPDASLYLLSHLDDADPEVRHAVISALEDLGDARAVVPLIGRIQEPRAPLRRQAIVALGTLGDARAASALIVALGDGDASVRAAAATSLGQLRFQDSVYSLGALLESEADLEVQTAALNALGAIATPGALQAILGTSSRRRWFGARVERALSSAGEGALPSLESCVFQPLNAEAAASCVAAAGAIGGPRATALVLRALREGVVEASRALAALAQCQDRSSLPAVLEYLTSESPAERRAAIEASGKLLDPEQRLGIAVEPIVLALNRAQSNRLERAALIGLLGRTGSPRAAAALIPIASSNDEYLRAIALEALGQLGPAGADSVLLAALDSDLFPTRWTAALALRRVGTRVSIDPLLHALERAPALRDETLAVALAGPLADGASDAQLARVEQQFELGSGPVKDALLEAMAGVPGARGTRLLDRLAQRGGKATRAKLAEVLGQHPEARQSLLRFSADPDPSVRANAVWALGNAALAEDVRRLMQLREDDDIAVASNAVGAAAHTLARLGLDGAPLCAALEDRRSYVLVNALAGLRSSATRCPRGDLPGWLLQHHRSDEVRIAAAALVRERPDLVPDAARLLARCVRKDASGRVAAACHEPPPARRGPGTAAQPGAGAPGTSAEPGGRAAAQPRTADSPVSVSILVVATGSSDPTPRAPFALVRGDGLIRSGTSDRRGSILEAMAPRGPLRLAVPAVFSE